MTGVPETGRETQQDFDWSWTDDDPEWLPPEIDTSRPSPARMYDYALGGKDNFAVDRAAVEKVAQVLPDFRRLALDNRGFLVRAVRIMAESGIRQFLDLGTGIPTSPNVHEVARAMQPDARVVYVDHDPIVMAHNRALRATTEGIVTVQHDLRQPAAILRDPQVREVLDLSQPVGVLFIAVLHFVRRDLAPEVVDQFRRAMAPGSYLAISTACRDGMEPRTVALTESVYEQGGNSFTFRTGSEVEALFEGFEQLEPGLADVSQWRAEGTPNPIRVLAGVGRLP